MKTSTRAVARNLWPLILGGLAFFAVIGTKVLAPTNIGWLGGGDPAVHYVGWLFFRHAPWTFPIGLNPTYGLELSNAIIFSDSNPLMAFVFKAIAPLLSEPFQYFGIWILACYLLQAWFGWKLAGLVSTSSAIRILVAGLFVFAPPFMMRMQAHLSLGAHFLVLAALYFALVPELKNRRLAWGALLVATSLVHAYLLAMVALLWLADLVQQRIIGRLTGRQSVLELGILSAVTGIACWQAGYFSVGDGTSAGGYGFFRMNLLSMVDPIGWSYVMKNLPRGGGDYEGFSFLGLGVIFLAVFAAAAMRTGAGGLARAIRKYRVLCVALAALALFAVSNHVGIGSLQYEFKLPPPLIRLASYFRASGRMFWPAFYVIVLAVIYLVVRGYGKRTATALLAFALAIQVADTSVVWEPFRTHLMAAPRPQLGAPLTGPFWDRAALRYRTIRSIPPGDALPNWFMVATYANENALSTDVVALARISKVALRRAKQTAAEQLATGRYDPETLYLLDDATFSLAASKINPKSDLLTKVDGFNILAPAWKQCADCPRVAGGAGTR